jgi:alkanesulfonate monooxygenase SsuD/methylene tetrahydromethanopterin reductase-like flavin-dependent oxidoreductase (luciferase family)
MGGPTPTAGPMGRPPLRHGVVILPEHRWSEAAPLWRAAEDLGFDHAWTYDHLMWRWLRESTWFSCLPTLTAAAAVTSRIGLGMLVATPSFRHPVPFAKELMTLDDISGGRLVAGIGSGAGGFDDDVLDSPELAGRRRADRFAEFVELTDRLLREPVTDHQGEFYTAREAHLHPGCLQDPRVPFAIAATGPRGMRLAATYADIWVTAGPPADFGAQPYAEALPGIGEQFERFTQACLEVGRDPDTVRRLVLTGSAVGGVLDSAGAYADASGRLAELGATDVVVHWPRPEFPYEGRPQVMEEIAATVLSDRDLQVTR